MNRYRPTADETPDERAAVARAPRSSRLGSAIIAAVLIGVAAVILTAGGIGWWYLERINPRIENLEAIGFTIEDTDTFDDVVNGLVDEGIIVDASVFRWYVERQGGLEPVPGFYRLVAGDHLGNILGRLRTPPDQTFQRVTFPEGFTLAQMARRLEAQTDTIDADQFTAAAVAGEVRPQLLPAGVDSLEGLLFPDTYLISNAEAPGQVVERMVAMMERVARQENLESRAAELGLTPYEVLIIASMIEREAKVPEDRARIASVIRNRLFLGMPLQIDATLYYGQDPETEFSILRTIDNAYNTYLYNGLPPTPIANPGRASIQAALHPAPNPPPSDPICRALPDPTRCYLLYYVLADERGGHAFAATLEQHEANIEAARAAGILD